MSLENLKIKYNKGDLRYNRIDLAKLVEKCVFSTVSAFSEIYLVDLEDDYYRMIYPNINSKSAFGNFSQSMEEKIGYLQLDPEVRKKVSSFLNIKNVSKELMLKKHIECRYQRRWPDGEYRWCKACFTVCDVDNGMPISATLSIQNIDDFVRERERQTALLKNAIETANAANMAKTQFLSRMSHDIRTPLNAIMGMVGLAKIYLDDRDKLEDCLEKMTAASNHLLGIINDVLDISRIESNSLQIVDERVNIPAIFRNLKHVLIPQITAKNQELMIDMKGIVHQNVYSDNMKLQQVFINIMSNAVKYTRLGGRIRVTGVEKDSLIENRRCFEFIVEDNGVGMSEEFLSKIFDPFSRESDDRIRNIQGSGLGMSITKSIVDKMKGRIEVTSRLEEGTRFVVSLDLIVCDDNAEDIDKAQIVTQSINGKRVLLVDDKELNREVVKEILELLKLSVDEAGDGREAYEMFLEKEDNYYDCIITDIQMPVMDGYELARAVRGLKKGEGIPIVALSANTFVEDKQKAINAGMDEYVSKPIDIGKLHTAVCKLIGV